MGQSAIEIIRRNSDRLEPVPTNTDIKLGKLTGIEAIMFDVYGTLFISGSGDVGYATANPTDKALEQAANAVGLQFNRPPGEILGRYYESIRQSHRKSQESGIEFPEVDILSIWRESLADQISADFSLDAFAIEFESRINPVWPMPNLVETLRELSQNHRMGIVSNAQFFTLELFEALLGETRLELGFDSDLEVYSFAERTAKPGTEIFQLAAERLASKGIRPEKVLYIGNDMLNDIRGAALVGFRTALFAGDQRSLRLRKEDQRVDDVEPDIIVNCLSQIPDCLH